MINTIINNFKDFDNSKNNEGKEEDDKNKENDDNPVLLYASNKYKIEQQIPSIDQGYKFTQYQDKIKQRVEFTIKNNHSNDVTNITKKSRENFENNNNKTSDAIIENLKKEYDKTLNEYNVTLSKYNDLAKQMQTTSSNYIERVNPNNKFLNKIIRFTRTGHLLYVTKQGVAKYIPSMDILNSISGKNGCPNTSGNYIPIDIPWLNEYSIEGTQLPTNPPLIIGKNMQLNESCGNEGSNVFVDKMMSSSPTPTYVGCYQDNNITPTMNFIGSSPSASNANISATYTYEECKKAAVLGGYQYFALQNADPSKGLGFCAVSNDIKTVQKNGPGYEFVPLWSSNTAGKPTTYAVVTKNGTLNVCDSNGTAYFTSPNGASCEQVYSTSWNVDAPGNDISYRTNVRRENCEQICNDDPNCGGFAWNRSTDNSCWLKSGKLTNTTGNNKRILIRKTVDTSKCNYFLALQTDGNMCIYKGEPNTSNIVGIWCTYTNGRQQKPNVNYTLTKSKYGMSFLKKDQILNKGDWVVSEDGKLLLIMQNDGNLVLYTFKSNCVAGSGNNSKNYYGGKLANALYDIGSVGIKSNMGKVAYIDADSQIYPYSTTNTSYSNSYNSVFQNANIQGNDIPGAAVSNVGDVNKCMDVCNKYSSCNAFVYDTTGPYPVCFPKKITENELYSPNTFKPSVGKTTYIRDKKPINSPIGTDRTVTNIDTITYQNYSNKGGEIKKTYGLENAISVQKQQLSQLQDKLNLLLSQLNNNIDALKKYNIDLTSETKNKIVMKPVEGFEDGVTKNVNAKNLFLNTTQTNYKINKLEESSGGIDNILLDSNIKTLQQNYNYMIWTILATASVIIAIKIKLT
jgi:hypothetical protein